VTDASYLKHCLLVGCGNCLDKQIKFPGSPEDDFSEDLLVTLDVDPDLKPDIVHDLNVLPYPLGDNEYDEIHAYEVLEHTGTQGDGEFFFAQFAEFYQALKPHGFMMITVPMWNHEVALGVPDHKRVFPKGVFSFLNPEYYKNVGKPRYGDYRKLLGDVDFRCVGVDETEECLRIVLQAIK